MSLREELPSFSFKIACCTDILFERVDRPFIAISQNESVKLKCNIFCGVLLISICFQNERNISHKRGSSLPSTTLADL
jgi:hypothetical protein